MADLSRLLLNNRRNEISLLLSRNGGETLLWRHEQLEEAAYALRWNWCQISRLNYDTILTGLNHEITQLPGLTNPDDLELARSLLGDKINAALYAEWSSDSE